MRDRRLRWPVAAALESAVRGRTIRGIDRRAKYLLIRFDAGTLILHLGMSGSLRLLRRGTPHAAHDHWDIAVAGGWILRFHDPRRFGSLHWTTIDPELHPLLKHLAPEPLSDEFDGAYLYKTTRRRTVAVKQLIMNSRLVVGVGNIYASESLFRAGIAPRRAARRLTRKQADALAQSIKAVLRDAIDTGGTTLRDYVNADGAPGSFRAQLFVYERAGAACRACGTLIKQFVQGQRSTYWCPACQR